MTVASTWTERRKVESFDVDRFGRLRPQALFGLLLNGAWNAAKGSSYGYEELSARNLMWVLVKLQLRIHRTPTWGEDILIETWGKRVERFYALRDFVVSTPDGSKLASATTVWMVIDKSRGRPQRLDPATDGFPWQPSREEMETSLEKVAQAAPAPSGAVASDGGVFKVHFSDIDVNQHVNAARYVQWLVDSHPAATLQGSELEEIAVSFIAEALQDEEVTVRSGGLLNGAELMAILRAGDGKELCRASLKWRDR